MQKSKSIIVFTAVVSGISVFINSLAVKIVPNAYLFTTAKNICVALFVFILIFSMSKAKELKKLTIKDWQKLFFLGVIGGSIPFLLFFQGLSVSKQTALNGAFIQKTMFIWVAILAVAFFKEKITTVQKTGLLVVLSGIILMGGLNVSTFGKGEVLIFIATLLWSIEAIFVSKYFKQMDFTIVSFGRMFFGSIIMLCYLFLTQKHSALVLTKPQLLWVYLTAGFLFVYVLSYYKSLTKFRATEVTSILTVAFPITVVCQSLYSGKSISNLLALNLVFVGVLCFLLGDMVKEKLLIRSVR